MTLLAIDPGRSYKGDATIGWAVYTDGAGEWFRGSMSWEGLTKRLTLEYVTPQDRRFLLDDDPDPDFWLSFDTQGTGVWTISEIVCEDFINDPQSARGGQRNGTSECIGAVEILAAIAMIPFTRQPSSDLGPAKLHAPEGSWKPLKHLRHEDSAYLHGYEFLVRKGVLQPAGLSATLE